LFIVNQSKYTGKSNLSKNDFSIQSKFFHQIAGYIASNFKQENLHISFLINDVAFVVNIVEKQT